MGNLFKASATTARLPYHFVYRGCCRAIGGTSRRPIAFDKAVAPGQGCGCVVWGGGAAVRASGRIAL